MAELVFFASCNICRERLVHNAVSHSRLAHAFDEHYRMAYYSIWRAFIGTPKDLSRPQPRRRAVLNPKLKHLQGRGSSTFVLSPSRHAKVGVDGNRTATVQYFQRVWSTTRIPCFDESAAPGGPGSTITGEESCWPIPQMSLIVCMIGVQCLQHSGANYSRRCDNMHHG